MLQESPERPFFQEHSNRSLYPCPCQLNVPFGQYGSVRTEREQKKMFLDLNLDNVIQGGDGDDED